MPLTKLIAGINKIKPLIITELIGKPFLYPFLVIATIPSIKLLRDMFNIFYSTKL
jgi:hypothetical protein